MDLEQSHSVSISSQTNVYSSCLLEWPRSHYHLLVASLHGSVMCLDYQKVAGQFRATTTDIQFLYIPADAEIVSIDCFCLSAGRKPVIGVTLVKPGQGQGMRAQFLNIYGARHATTGVTGVGARGSDGQPGQLWKSIAEDWHACVLQFKPLRLYHTTVGTGRRDNDVENVFLLSGSDGRVHVYRCERVLLTFLEDDVNTVRKCFPEFKDAFSSCVMSFDISHLEQEQRIVAVGLESGDLQIFQTDLSSDSPTVLRTFSNSNFDGPITSLKLFSPVSSKSLPLEDSGHSLVSSCAVEMAAVFQHVTLCGFSLGSSLAECRKYDSVLCTCVADIDGDGRNEVTIGTYGHMLLVYRQSGPLTDLGDFRLVYEQRLSQPIYGILSCDLIGDGSQQLLVVMLNTVVVFQPELSASAQRCVGHLKAWKEIEDLRSKIQSLGEAPAV